MWIRKSDWEAIQHDERAEREFVHAKNIELEKANTFIQTSMEWLQVRLNQVEVLNAKLIEKETGVIPAVPHIGKPLQSIDDMLGDASELFSDPDEG